jgi:hypothetical protein
MTSRNETRRRLTGRQTIHSFVRFPHELLNHQNFSTLSTRATKLLIDIASQYNGRNNGDLCAPLSKMRNRGWNSSDQLFKAKKELEGKGLIRVSRQGGLNKCNLYAMTWFSIDECDGKLDIASTITAPNDWKHSSDPHGGSDSS